ncbi:hypothetical protein ACHAWF_018839 [Thalassiosira exigua]
MLERYLLSALATKFGHVFEDFDESTTAELSAWRGVLALRNLHLRKDALRHLGVPLAGDDGDHDDDGDSSEDENDDDASHQDPSCAHDAGDGDDDGGSGEASDDDSFLSCASHMDDDDIQASTDRPKEREDKSSPRKGGSRRQRGSAPVIEVVHGSIGSLELHIPWSLLRATKAAALGKGAGKEKLEDSKLDEKEDGSLGCSAVLSDVRILLAPRNHSRNESSTGKKSGIQRQNDTKQADKSQGHSSRKAREQHELERLRKERELEVQSMLEAELFRLMQRTNDSPAGSANGGGIQGGNDTPVESREGWMARWAKGLVARILSSLRVTVQNIHVRYEDEGYGWFDNASSPPPSHSRRRYRPAFAAGIRLGSFSIGGTGTDGVGPVESLDDGKASTSTVPHLHHKTAKVDKLSVYWDSSHPDLFVSYKTSEEDREYYEKRFEELDIMSSDDFESDDPQHSYLIQPISPSLQLVMDGADANGDSTSNAEVSNGDVTTLESPPAAIHASLCVPSCHINFDRHTLEDVAYVRKCLSSYKAQIISAKERILEQRVARQLLDLRPPAGVRPRDNPRLWWKFAIESVRALQSDRRYFEGKVDTRRRMWRRDGWLGLARLLRLRTEYTSLYCSLWKPQQHEDSKGSIHRKLLALEDLLNNKEIVAFRIAVFIKLADMTNPKPCSEEPVVPALDMASESLDVDELALASLSAVSLEFRETKLRQIVRSIDIGSEKFDVAEHHCQTPKTAKSGGGAAMWVVSIACDAFTVQANDIPHANSREAHVRAPSERQQAVPIVRLQCLSSLRFEKFSNGSWDLSLSLSSLTVSDLISPHIDKSSHGRVLIGRKQPGSMANKERSTVLNDQTASIVIRNVVSDDVQAPATTYFRVNVLPLEVVYSTNAFEALSRLFAAMKTREFNRDYGRITQALSRWRLRQGNRLMSVLARQKKFVVEIGIAAPVLFIPQDPQDTTSPTLMVDLGQLTFRSDCDAATSSGFDDKWLLQVDNVRAVCIHQRSCPEASREHAIIKPFSLKFSISTHIAADDASSTDVTKINIEGELPSLCFNFHTSAVRLVSCLRRRWDDAKSRNPQLPRRQTLGDILKGSRVPLHDRASHVKLFDDVAKLEAASAVDVSNAAVAKKQEVNFSFSAPTIALQIGNDVDFDRQATASFIPLLNLSIRGIHGNFASHTSEKGTSSQFSARLRSIHAQDVQKSGSHFCHFVSSVDPDLLQDCDSSVHDGDEDLVAVDEKTETNGDKQISIKFHQLFVEWNPELLARVQTSLQLPPESEGTSSSSEGDISNQISNESEFFDAVETTDSCVTAGSAASYSAVEEVGYQPGIKPMPLPQSKVLFHLKYLRVNFNKDSQHRCLFSAEMNETYICFRRKPLGGSVTTATVANARLKDPGGETGGTLYTQMIGLQSGGFCTAKTSSIVNMSFESFTNHNEEDPPEFHNVMKLEFSEMRFVYIHQFWMEVFDFFFEGILGHAVWGTKPKPSAHYFNPSEATRPFRRTRMSIEMEKPLILLPMCYRSPQHLRLHMSELKVRNHFSKQLMTKKEGAFTIWTQWFNNCKVEMCDLDVRSWDERKLNEEVSSGRGPPSMTLDIRWPVGPTAPLVKPKWNVVGSIDPIQFCLSGKDFSLFRFFVSYNLLEPSRFLSKQTLPGATMLSESPLIDVVPRIPSFVLFGYEKTGVPPTTYSIKLTSDSLKFQFVLDEEESESRKVEGMMNIDCSKFTWSMLKHADCILKQRANLQSIRLTQTSARREWDGFPDLLLPLPTSVDVPLPHDHCLLQFTSTSHPNGNNVKTLHLDSAGIYMILPAWQHVGSFFKHLPTSPEVFAPEEMSSIMQVGDRFYRMSKSRCQAGTNAESTTTKSSTSPHASSSKQFLLTLTSPRIILVEDATEERKDCSLCVTLSMENLDFLRDTDPLNETNTVFCDGLEVFTGMAKDALPCSSLLCPLSISGSMTKTMNIKGSPPTILGWIWLEELQACATYTDLTHAMNVLEGVKKQLSARKCNKTAGKSTTPAQATLERSLSDKVTEDSAQSRMRIDVLIDGLGIVVTDDSQRHFANAQPLVAVEVVGIRLSRVATDPQESATAHSSEITKGLRYIANTFVSLDSLELSDLIQSEDSPFRVMATSSQSEPSKRGLFSFTSQIELEAQTWPTHRMVQSEWGFGMSPSLKTRQEATAQLTPPSSHFDRSPGRHEHLVAFQSVLYENGLHCVDFDMQHLTAQWNPSTVIALQRFLGRLKKAARSILFQPVTIDGGANDPTGPSTTKEQHGVVFSLNANVESICICLNKEYQQRRLLDALVTGIKIRFERNKDQSLVLQGSIQNMRAWDPDMSKPRSDRNRHILATEDEEANVNGMSDPFFSFQYRTFRAPTGKPNGQMCLPSWVEQKIDGSSGGIDDFLQVKMKTIELNYVSERTAELADYLKHGLPGKGMGATSKAAQKFYADRIRTRSFLDIHVSTPRVFIPRSPSSLVGGIYLSMGTVAVTSWFEESCAHSDDQNELVQTQSISSWSDGGNSFNEMDWWRVLDMKLGIGIKIEAHRVITGMSNPDTFFQSSVTVRKPSYGKTTLIEGKVPSLNIHLKYREFIMLNLVAAENIGVRIDESKWDNIEKSYWQSEDKANESSSDHHESNLQYAESARFVRFGEAKASKGNQTKLVLSVDSITLTLTRDDWAENIDEENAALLCYEICKFSIHKMAVNLVKHSNGDRNTTIALYDMSFVDVGDIGRLARDVYMGSRKRPPCAFSVVAEGYQSSEDPLLLLSIGRQASSGELRDDEIGDTHHDKIRAIKTIELKVNSLSITVLPRSIDDVVCFLSKKWSCPNSNLEQAGPVLIPTSSEDNIDVSPSSVASSSTTDTVRFKFVAIYPRVILLADESDPFSRALVLRGFAVGNMSSIHEKAPWASRYGQVDVRSTTTLSGHVKELATYVHNNIDNLIGPSRSTERSNSMGVALIEPVTSTVELRVVSRSRFPTSRFVSVDIDHFATLLSFGDLILIERILNQMKKRKASKEIEQGPPETPTQPTPKTPHDDSLQFSKSSDYSDFDEGPPLFDVVILTKRVGLQLRKSGPHVVIETSSNPSVEAGDTLQQINGVSVERMTLPAIVEKFEHTPRPLTITLSRDSDSPVPGQKVLDHLPSYHTNGTTSKSTNSNSLSFDITPFESLKSENANFHTERHERARPSQVAESSRLSRLDVICNCGLPNGLEIVAGLGGAAVINTIDYETLVRCAQSNPETESIASLIALKRLPLPGAILLAIDGKELTYEEVVDQLKSNETRHDETYTLSLIETDSTSWGKVSHFEGKLGLTLTIIDDTNGRDMPVIRAGLKQMSFAAKHGLAIATTKIQARRPSILDFDQHNSDDSSSVLTLESQVSRLKLDFYNAPINEWEPILEPHFLRAAIERQPGTGSFPGQFDIVISDHTQSAEPSPLEFICVNVSDSALNMLGKAVMNWRQCKGPKPPGPGTSGNTPSPITSPRQLPHSPVFGRSNSTSSAADLKKATSVAKLALDFSRKRRGKTTHTDANSSAFVFRNRTGLRISFTANGTTTTFINDGGDAQFQMSPVNQGQNSQAPEGTRLRKYDGEFPTVDVELGFDALETHCALTDEAGRGVSADRIENLPTGKAGRILRSVRVYKKKKTDILVTQLINVVWTVKLKENRRVLTLSSATMVKAFGCGPSVEVGVRFATDNAEKSPSEEIAPIGSTAQKNIYFLPLWIEACFRQIDVFIRPPTQLICDKRERSTYKWSTFPVLCLKEKRWSADAREVTFDWITDLPATLGGVCCPLDTTEGDVQSSSRSSVWLNLTYSEESSSLDMPTAKASNFANDILMTTVTVWSALTIRNMLPCNVEWEVGTHRKAGEESDDISVFDSSLSRDEHRSQCQGTVSFSSKEMKPHVTHSSLQCGSAVEVFTEDNLQTAVTARFKCVVRGETYWSDWLTIELRDGTMKKSMSDRAVGVINVQCRNGSSENPLTIGAKLTPRSPDPGKGWNIILYAEVWLRNLTTIPLAFGAPSLQVGYDDVESTLPGKVSADSALIELTSVLEGNSFGLFGASEDDEDLDGNDIVNLPIQQCDEVWEEVFEYTSMNEKGNVDRRWWASENHLTTRQEPQKDSEWFVDCAGEPLLQNGWESSASCTFAGKRIFKKSHRFRRRRWFRKVKMRGMGDSMRERIKDRVIFHQPADLDLITRSRREAERNAIGVQIDEKEEDGPSLLDIFNRPQHEGVLDIMTKVANDGSILINVKHKDGKWSTPAIIPPSGSSTGVLRVCSSRWPSVTKAIQVKERRTSQNHATWDKSSADGCDLNNLGIAPLEPSVFELIYQVTVLSGPWGELGSRMVTITPRFVIRNESSWLDIDVKQVGAPDTSRISIKKGEMLPFYWYNMAMPELVCVKPSQWRNRMKWSGGFDLCTLGMIPVRVRQCDGSIDDGSSHSNLSLRISVELQPGSGGSGTIVSIRDEDPSGEGSLFRIENHSPFPVFISQDGVLSNPVASLRRNDSTFSCDIIPPGKRSSYSLDVPWRQGKYAGRMSASMSELLLVRCALAPLNLRDGAESTKVICLVKVGDSIRLSPSKLSSTISSQAASDLLGVRVLGVIGTDGPTRTLRFILMQKEVTTTSYISNAMRENISPMPSFISVDSATHDCDDDAWSRAIIDAAEMASQLFHTGSLPDQIEATKQAFFGTGICKRSSPEGPDRAYVHVDDAEAGDEFSFELSCSGVIISIIDSSPTELAALSLHDVRVGASWNSLGNGYARSRMSVGWLQLDNHCPNSVYPVAIRPILRTDASWEDKGDGNSDKKPFTVDQPFAQAKIDFAPRHRSGIQSLTVGAAMHDTEIFLDLAFILRMQRFLVGIQDHILEATGNASWGFVDSQEKWELPNFERLLKQKAGKAIRPQSIYFQVNIHVAS